MPRPKQRTPLLRDQVLDVALDLLAREGAAGFSTRAIAREASTSTPAVYELFGNRAGLLREVFFAGFRRLGAQLAATPETDDPRAGLVQLAEDYRAFLVAHPELAGLMFSRPFADFSPGPEESQAGADVRELIVARIRRAIDAGALRGDATDIAHAYVSLIQGLAAAENARRLGTSKASVDRRWRVAVEALLDGLR